MHVLLCVALALIGAGAKDPLDEICHSNDMQHTEDQVIEKVVKEMDADNSGVIKRSEVLVFVANVMGINLGGLIDLVADLSDEQILMAAAGMSIHKDSFVTNWNVKYHDSKPFVAATFDRFDINGDGLMNALEVEGIVNNAINHGDANQDKQLQTAEMVSFLEKIYKHC